MCGLRRCFSWLAFVVLIAVTGGCTAYYVVKDPVNGSLYYTQDIDHAVGGAVKFRDDRTGNIVTLQNSDIKEIDKREYDIGKYSSK